VSIILLTCKHVHTIPQKGHVYGAHKKGIYVDGHERADVVEYRKTFLSQISEYEKLMWDYDEVTLEPIPKDLPGKRHILVTHDESTFNANDDLKRGWHPNGEQPLKKEVKRPWCPC